MLSPVLQISPKISVLPIVHGSGDFAIAVRRVMLQHKFDCLAVPLPPSFQKSVNAGLRLLPIPSAVYQLEPPSFRTDWQPPELGLEDADEESEENEAGDEDEPGLSYVPIDPCQGVIAAIRLAQQERIPQYFIDLETARFQVVTQAMPDPYALKQVSIERYSAAMLPAIPPLPAGQPRERVAWMAAQLHKLERHHRSILLVCSVLEWPWIRDAYRQQLSSSAENILAENDEVLEPELAAVEYRTLAFMLGELPFITQLYERARSELEDDENLSIDGVKELLITAREAYRREFKGRARKITPHALQICLKYIRNLTLMERRLSPDLYTLMMAAKQTIGDNYALHVIETARQYLPENESPTDSSATGLVKMGIGRMQLPDGELRRAVSRLPGAPVTWGSCQIRRRPERDETIRWQMKWNPFSQCSWPPEDELIENFRSHLFDKAKAIMGADLAKTEKFTTSIKDGIDIRETLRNWHTGEIYVKSLPPARGKLDCVLMLFDSPADPRDYTWRSTWYAEHENESTLAFFATDFGKELVGPGIALSSYGGAMFLFPPVPIPDVWTDPRLDFCETLEERLAAACCLHSRCRHIAVLSANPPGAGFRRLAKRYGKNWVHVPLAQFGQEKIAQLRMVHVLNGKEVRSYAANFIRKA